MVFAINYYILYLLYWDFYSWTYLTQSRTRRWRWTWAGLLVQLNEKICIPMRSVLAVLQCNSYWYRVTSAFWKKLPLHYTWQIIMKYFLHTLCGTAYILYNYNVFQQPWYAHTSHISRPPFHSPQLQTTRKFWIFLWQAMSVKNYEKKVMHGVNLIQNRVLLHVLPALYLQLLIQY